MNFYICVVLSFYPTPISVHCSSLQKSRAPVTHMAETTSMTGTLLSLLGGVSPSIEQQCPLVDLHELVVKSIKNDGRLINGFETQFSNPVPHIWCVCWRSCVHLKPCLDKESNNKHKCSLVFCHWGLKQQFAFRHYANTSELILY